MAKLLAVIDDLVFGCYPLLIKLDESRQPKNRINPNPNNPFLILNPRQYFHFSVGSFQSLH
jgi:hypothetical protein